MISIVHDEGCFQIPRCDHDQVTHGSKRIHAKLNGPFIHIITVERQYKMMEAPPMAILNHSSSAKEEEVDQLMEDGDLSDMEDDSDPNEFRVYDPLPQYKEYKRKLSEVHSKHIPGVQNYINSLSLLTAMIHAGEIELNPPYQRGSPICFPSYFHADPSIDVVWSDEKQSQLIESIFRNYTIPQVVFALRREDDDEDEVTRICVDGKQVGSHLFRC